MIEYSAQGNVYIHLDRLAMILWRGKTTRIASQRCLADDRQWMRRRMPDRSSER